MSNISLLTPTTPAELTAIPAPARGIFRRRIARRIIVALTATAAAFSFAAPAGACQLVCMLTSNTYSGNLGGFAGADDKCREEFPGFKFARSASITANLAAGFHSYRTNYPGDQSYTAWAGGGYINDATSGMTNNFNCNGWTNSFSGSTLNDYGITIRSANSGQASGIWSVFAEACNNSRPLLCCNM